MVLFDNEDFDNIHDNLPQGMCTCGCHRRQTLLEKWIVRLNNS